MYWSAPPSCRQDARKAHVTKDTAAHPGPAPAKSTSQAATYVTSAATAHLRGEDRGGDCLAVPADRDGQLAPRPVGFRAKFAEGEITFWSKGEEAMLEVEEGGRRNCRNNRAMAIWERCEASGCGFPSGWERAWLEPGDIGRRQHRVHRGLRADRVQVFHALSRGRPGRSKNNLYGRRCGARSGDSAGGRDAARIR